MGKGKASGPKVLGTLVDRAVSMPYSKPQLLRQGRRISWNPDKRSIVDDAIEAAVFLQKVLTARGVKHEWSKAVLAVDPAGPWWSKTRDDFCDALSPDDQEWVTKRLVPTVSLAAQWIQDAARAERWTWLWSQPSFAVPGDDIPVITRPDLVAGYSATRCLVIDLKTTSGKLDEVPWSTDRFGDWTDHLSAARFDVVGRWVLAVPTDRTEALWIEVP